MLKYDFLYIPMRGTPKNNMQRNLIILKSLKNLTLKIHPQISENDFLTDHVHCTVQVHIFNFKIYSN